MPYYQGDPFFGAVAGLGIGVLKKVAPKVLGKVGGAIGRAVGRKPIIKTAGKVAATGAVFELGAKAVRGRGNDGEKKYRRMNVGNAKALRRAIRRMKGFEKMARRVISFSSGRSAPRGKFKKARRAS